MKHVLVTNETVKIPTGKNQPFGTLRTVVWLIIVLFILGSFVFGENLFLELSLTTRMLFIALVISSIFWGPKTQPVPSAIEIRFYDDYLVVYRKKRYYDKKVTRQEFNKFYYANIEEITYDYYLKRLNIYGDVDYTWYNYNADGSIPEKPSHHRVVNGGICYFYVNGDDEDNILTTLEKYSSKVPKTKKKFEN